MKEQMAMRLAIREEGEFVNAYHAAPNTMEGAMLVGSIRAAILRQHRDIWQDWKNLMTRAYQVVIHDVTGIHAEMNEQAAPEHEKSGRA
jgi:hypothetical protein